MRGQIKEVLTGLAKATVIVTHDQLEALIALHAHIGRQAAIQPEEAGRTHGFQSHGQIRSARRDHHGLPRIGLRPVQAQVRAQSEQSGGGVVRTLWKQFEQRASGFLVYAGGQHGVAAFGQSAHAGRDLLHVFARAQHHFGTSGASATASVQVDAFGQFRQGAVLQAFQSLVRGEKALGDAGQHGADVVFGHGARYLFFGLAGK